MQTTRVDVQLGALPECVGRGNAGSQLPDQVFVQGRARAARSRWFAGWWPAAWV